MARALMRQRPCTSASPTDALAVHPLMRLHPASQRGGGPLEPTNFDKMNGAHVDDAQHETNVLSNLPPLIIIHYPLY